MSHKAGKRHGSEMKHQASEEHYPVYHEHEEHVHAEEEYTYLKCGNASVDHAIVALAQLGHYDWFDNWELITAIVLFYVATSVKFTLLIFFWLYWVNEHEAIFKDPYFSMIKTALLNATTAVPVPVTLHDSYFVQPEWGTNAMMSCAVSRSPSLIYFMTLWVWFGSAFNLIGDSFWRYFLVNSFEEPSGQEYIEGAHVQLFPLVHRNEEMKAAVRHRKLDPPPVEKQVKENISKMRTWKRWFSYFAIVTPDFLLNLTVAYVGAKYIAVTAEINLIVKASLKMNFIARLDKIIYPSYVSYNWENFISAAQYKSLDVDEQGSQKFQKFMRIFETWVGTQIKAFMGLIGAIFFVKVFFPRIAEFRGLCQDYYELFPSENVLPGLYPQDLSKVNHGWYPTLR